MTSQDIIKDYRNVQYAQLEHLQYLAVSISADALNYLEQNEDIAIYGIEMHGSKAFELIKKQTQNIAFFAIQQDVTSFYFLQDHLKTEDFYLKIITNNKKIFSFLYQKEFPIKNSSSPDGIIKVPLKIPSLSKEFILNAIDINPHVINFLKNDPNYYEYSLLAIRKEPYLLSDVVQTKELVDIAILSNIKLVKYINIGLNTIIKNLFNSNNTIKMKLGYNLWKALN
jgi:hypothetical protein